MCEAEITSNHTEAYIQDEQQVLQLKQLQYDSMIDICMIELTG